MGENVADHVKKLLEANTCGHEIERFLIVTFEDLNSGETRGDVESS